MNAKQIETLSKKIARDLMTMNTGEKAKRLQLMDKNEKPLGGRCMESVVEVIENHLQAALANSK